MGDDACQDDRDMEPEPRNALEWSDKLESILMERLGIEKWHASMLVSRHRRMVVDAMMSKGAAKKVGAVANVIIQAERVEKD
jgi:hypothetical protein